MNAHQSAKLSIAAAILIVVGIVFAIAVLLAGGFVAYFILTDQWP